MAPPPALLASLPAGRLADWHFARLAATRGAGLAAGDELVEVAMMETLHGEGGGDSEGSYRVHDPRRRQPLSGSPKSRSVLSGRSTVRETSD
ncbi:hypothetical protein AQ490_25455 [Wenjunlia vitaminophila]|uniref:Uncharacterized protein n=1 Tax=Wenjunlia vitaminophila TaxID=76728 RepID=A0A0T6LQF8_WENVI|nr:hypothetical protein AQ490_25455 [Wenjunlia vitaminophila]